MIGFGGLELLHDPNLGVRRRAVVLVGAGLLGRVVAILGDLSAIINVEALRLNVGGADELDLFRLLIAERRRALESVEVKFVEGFFAHYRSHRISLLVCPRESTEDAIPTAALFKLVDVSGEQLDTGVLEGLTALVVHGDPAGHVELIGLVLLIGVVGDDQVVIGLPAHAAADVGNLGVGFSGGIGFEQPA